MKKKAVLLGSALLLGMLFLMGMESAYNVVGFRAFEAGDYQGALNIYLANGDHSGAGVAYCGLKQFDNAIASFQKAGDLSGIGMAHLGKRRYDDAIGYFTKKKDNSGLGLAYCGMKNFKAAREYFTKANDYSGMGLAALGENKIDEARDWFTKIGDKGGLGLCLLAERRYDEAISQFASNKDNSGMGLAYLGIGDLKQAESYFTRANDLSGLGFVKLNDKKYNEAIDLFTKANDSSGLGFVCAQMSDYKNAEDFFKQANDNSGLGRIALTRKQFKEAAGYFTAANDNDGLGDIYWQLRNFDKAISYFKAEGNDVKVVQALREKRDNGLSAEGKPISGGEVAIAYAQNIIAQGKFVNPMHLEIGHIYFEVGKYDEALKEYEEVLNGGSCYAAEALMWIGKVRYYQKNYDLSLEALNRLVREYPSSFYADEAQRVIEIIKTLKANLTAQNRCGPEALSILLSQNGIKADPQELALLAGTDEQGTTMLGLKRAAGKKGLNLTALKLAPLQLSAYKEKAILFIDGSHFVFLKDINDSGIIVIDASSDLKISYNELENRWHGEALAIKDKQETEELAFEEVKKIKGGNRRSSEGGPTKNDPGVLPNGAWEVEYGRLGPVIPKDYLIANNLFDSASGYDPQKDGGLGMTYQGSNTWQVGDPNCSRPADPIAVTGGQVIIPHTDMVIPGRGAKHGMSLQFSRIYSSSSEFDGPLGFGWALDHDVRLEAVDDLTTMVVTAPDGTKFSYVDNGGGTYNGPQCDGSTLVRNFGNSFDWTRWTHMYGLQKYHFEPYFNGFAWAYYLIYTEDLNGNRLTYYYTGFLLTRIVDGAGRYLEFSYEVPNATGKISKVTAAAGASTITYNFTYDAGQPVLIGPERVANNLIKVTGPEGYSETYEYNDPLRIHTITASIDANGNRTEYTYNRDTTNIAEVCVNVVDPAGNSANYSYNFGFGITNITDTRGRTTRYEYKTGKITGVTDSDGGVASYDFDISYFRNNLTDSHGNTTQWTSEPNFGNALTVTDAEGNISTFTWNPDCHQVASITDPQGRVWQYNYDAKGNLIERITSAPHNGGLTHIYIEYDQYGNRTKITDAEGLITRNEYDIYGNLTKTTDGEGNYIRFTYDSLSRLTSSRYGSISGEDLPTAYEYDGLSRLVKKTYPDGSYEQYAYDKNSNLLSFKDANGHTTTNIYSKLNQRIQETDPVGNITQYEYDPFGSLTKLTRTSGGTALITRYEYDHYSRLKKVTDPEGFITIYTYESSPPLLRSDAYTTMKKYKPDGSLLTVQARTYDKLYRLKTVKDGLNDTVTNTYDEVGNLISVTDPNGRITTYTYDPNVNILLSETDPLGKTTSYTYYRNGKLKTKRDANGNATTYAYDLAGNLKTATYPDSTSVVYQYNRYGKVSQMTDKEGLTSYTYNQRTWLTSVDSPQPNDTISYSYDSVGNRIKMTAATEGIFTYSYYDNNLQKTLTNPQSQTTTFSYDTANRLIKMTYANGTTTDFSYYKNDKTKDLTVKNGSLQTVSSYHYDYNSFAQLTKITDKDLNAYDYAYDDAGRLTHEDKKNASLVTIFSRDYAYDFSGNRLTEVRDGVLITYSYNNANQITSRTAPGEAISYSYDSNGSLITETSSLSGAKTYSYDFEDRLLSVIPANAGIQSTYTYSGDSRRTSSNTNGNIVKYIYDGMTPLIERDASNVTQAVYTKNPFSIGGIGGLISSIEPALPAAGHIPEVAIDRGRVLNVIFNTYYYHDSNLGNVNQITDSTGAVVQTYDYDSFGNITNQTGSLTIKYAYKTKEYSPETGLVFFGARYYNPLIGRFITKDPLGMVDGPNVYLYLNNDPLNDIDPWGLKPGDSYSNQDTAGEAAINDINSTSISQGKEYGGYIYQKSDGTYSYTSPKEGTKDSVTLPARPSDATGWYHTHGANDPGYKNEEFSEPDKDISRSVGPGYLGTPSKAINKYAPDSNTTTNIGVSKKDKKAGCL